MKWLISVTRECSTKAEADGLCAQAEKRGWKAKKTPIASKRIDFDRIRKAIGRRDVFVKRYEDGGYGEQGTLIWGAIQDALAIIQRALRRGKPRAVISYESSVYSPKYGDRRWTELRRTEARQLQDAAREAFNWLKRHGLRATHFKEDVVTKPTFRSVPDGSEEDGSMSTYKASFCVGL